MAKNKRKNLPATGAPHTPERTGAAVPRLMLRRVGSRLTGAKLCYGKAVVSNGRTVIPVAKVRAAGGYGFGWRDQTPPEAAGEGGGGGGAMSARPLGFIDIGPEGANFRRIDARSGGLARVGPVAGGAAAGAFAGAGAVVTIAVARRGGRALRAAANPGALLRSAMRRRRAGRRLRPRSLTR